MGVVGRGDSKKSYIILQIENSKTISVVNKTVFKGGSRISFWGGIHIEIGNLIYLYKSIPTYYHKLEVCNSISFILRHTNTV